ncbi:MAG: BNR-4 repeat-containing protein [Bacteroidales bacterium]|nr:BNR-4 repeat-containing protein [Bacteroidales bacterium]
MRNLLICVLFVFSGLSLKAQSLNNKTIDGYRGIWFSLGQVTEYGDKYSGGLGTYTEKHNPIAIYAKAVDKTFFVYGGTTNEKERHLLCMIGCYDHKMNLISKPRVVYDKEKVNDPHDNPSLLIDDKGYLWVFVSGRGRGRMGHKYRSDKPYSIDSFIHMTTSEMTYPQPMYIKGSGFFHFFTKYTGIRELYYQTSSDGVTWSRDTKLAGMIGKGEKQGGHYQVGNHLGNKIVTFFNRHPNGDVDKRTNIYGVQTTDFGKTWTTLGHIPLTLPITDANSKALLLEVESQHKNVYIKDVNFNSKGNPVVLYIVSSGYLPGPGSNPREWYVGYWDGQKWVQTYVTNSTHNYDSGSIWVEGDRWTVIGPSEEGPQKWGAGGEIAMWQSENWGQKWKKVLQYTQKSTRNNSYVRRPVDAKDPFYCFWADGDADKFSISRLYFGDSKGHVYELPYTMVKELETPQKSSVLK